MSEGSYRVFVGGISANTSDEMIRREFSQYAPVQEIDRKPRRTMVTYDTLEDAQEAVDKYNGMVLDGQTLVVENPRPATRQKPIQHLDLRVLVRGLAARTSWQDVKDWAREALPGIDVLYTNVFDLDGKRCAILEYQTEEILQKALAGLANKPLDDEKVSIERGDPAAEYNHAPRSRKRAGGGGGQGEERKGGGGNGGGGEQFDARDVRSRGGGKRPRSAEPPSRRRRGDSRDRERDRDRRRAGDRDSRERLPPPRDPRDYEFRRDERDFRFEREREELLAREMMMYGRGGYAAMPPMDFDRRGMMMMPPRAMGGDPRFMSAYARELDERRYCGPMMMMPDPRFDYRDYRDFRGMPPMLSGHTSRLRERSPERLRERERDAPRDVRDRGGPSDMLRYGEPLDARRDMPPTLALSPPNRRATDPRRQELPRDLSPRR